MVGHARSRWRSGCSPACSAPGGGARRACDAGGYDGRRARRHDAQAAGLRRHRGLRRGRLPRVALRRATATSSRARPSRRSPSPTATSRSSPRRTARRRATAACSTAIRTTRCGRARGRRAASRSRTRSSPPPRGVDVDVPEDRRRRGAARAFAVACSARGAAQATDACTNGGVRPLRRAPPAGRRGATPTASTGGRSATTRRRAGRSSPGTRRGTTRATTAASRDRANIVTGYIGLTTRTARSRADGAQRRRPRRDREHRALRQLDGRHRVLVGAARPGRRARTPRTTSASTTTTRSRTRRRRRRVRLLAHRGARERAQPRPGPLDGEPVADDVPAGGPVLDVLAHPCPRRRVGDAQYLSVAHIALVARGAALAATAIAGAQEPADPSFSMSVSPSRVRLPGDDAARLPPADPDRLGGRALQRRRRPAAVSDAPGQRRQRAPRGRDDHAGCSRSRSRAPAR